MKYGRLESSLSDFMSFESVKRRRGYMAATKSPCVLRTGADPVCSPSPASHSNLLNTCLFARTWCLFQGAKGWLFISTPAATVARGSVFFELSVCPSVCRSLGKWNSHHHETTQSWQKRGLFSRRPSLPEGMVFKFSHRPMNTDHLFWGGVNLSKPDTNRYFCSQARFSVRVLYF